VSAPAPSGEEILIGIVSDTHGLVRPQVPDLLRGCDLIVHAGDVGGEDVLNALADIAPVRAVRGNTDHGPWAATLPETEVVEAGSLHLYVLHDISRFDLDPSALFQVVVFGHSHKPAAYRHAGVLYLNPGSIGPRRFRLPISLALLRVRGGVISPEFIEIDG
jgi:putative phosphoesterase